MPVLHSIVGLLAAATVAAAAVVTLPLQSRTAAFDAAGSTRLRVRQSGSGYNVGLTDWFNRTDNQWYTTIGVGTPPQNMTVLWDTGSSQLLLPRSTCTTCGTHKLFDSSKSTTFSAKPGTRSNPLFSTGADSIPFKTPEGASGLSVHDTITLGPFTSKSQSFILCDKYADALDTMPIDGIMGLGPRSTSTATKPFYWNLYDEGQLDSAVFSFYTPPGDLYGAELTLGGIDTTKYTGEIQYTAFSGGGFNLRQQGVYIGSTLLADSAATAILDTGTAFMQTPDYATAKKLYAAISPKITQIDSAGAWGAACDTLDSVAPDITFRLGPAGKAINLTIPKASFNLGEYPGQPGICQALFNNPLSSFGGAWLVGSPLLKQYYTVWDAINLEIGWATLAPAA